MAATIPCELGTLYISYDVIAKIAGVSATECFGVLGLAASDGWSDMLKKETVDKGVRVNSHGNSIVIELSVIVKYGVSISAVAKNIIDNVKYKVELFTGLGVEAVNVIIRGIRL